MNKRKDMVYNEKLISGAEMMAIEGLVLTEASDKKHKVFKRCKVFKNLICKN